MGRNMAGNFGGGQRESGIEFAKCFAIIGIVISHMAQTAGSKSLLLPQLGCYFHDSNFATDQLQYFILVLFRCLGLFGNNIFFICSAYFLTESRQASYRKIIVMLLDVWVISALFLTGFLAAGVDVPVKEIVRALFPTTFGSNWYITCYLLFYAIHPYLNKALAGLGQKEHLLVTLGGLFLYFGLSCIKSGLFFGSKLIEFVVLYFAVSYVKKYLDEVFLDRRLNLILLGIGIFGMTGLLWITNIIGLKIRSLADVWTLTHWVHINNPLIVFIAFAVFNLCRRKEFSSGAVNGFACLSMLIYLIHENKLFKSYVRVYAFARVFQADGHTHIVFWVLLFSVVTVAGTAILSILYRASVGKLARAVSDRLYLFLQGRLDWFAERMMTVGSRQT